VNLKQKTFLFVSVSITALLAAYIGLSSSYVRSQEKLLLNERAALASAIAEELAGFFDRGVTRLQTVAALPGLVYGLQTLEEKREGKQIPAWATLHYLFYESDVFTKVYLVNASARILWSEPPDQDLIETRFDRFEEILRKLQNTQEETGFLLSATNSDLDLIVAAPLTNPEGHIIGVLAGTTPHTHPAIHAMLGRIGKEHGTVQLVDDETGRVIASSDAQRELQSFQSPDSSRFLVVTERVGATPWQVVIDQDAM